MNWRTDIENAPKDDTSVLLYDQRTECTYMCHWAADYNSKSSTKKWLIDMSDDDQGYAVMTSPTHWCPVTEPNIILDNKEKIESAISLLEEVKNSPGVSQHSDEFSLFVQALSNLDEAIIYM